MPSLQQRPSAEDISLKQRIEEITKEHIDLKHQFDALSEAANQPAKAPDLAVLMSNLDDELAAHFQLEEVDGIFDQVEKDAPVLAHEVRSLRKDHVELREESLQLVDLARAIRTPEDQKQFALLFRRFRERVREHESSETIVVQRAYCDDMGTKD